MKSRLRKKLRRWLRQPERRRKLEEINRMYKKGLLTPGETWGALKGWEGARSGAEYVNLEAMGK